MLREMAGVSEADNRRPQKPAWPGRVVCADGGTPEVWLAWGTEAETLMPLFPWLLKEALPTSDGFIAGWEPDPGGRWLRAVGRGGLSPEELESHIKSMLSHQFTQAQFNRALLAREEYTRAKALHPLMALEENIAFSAPTLEALNRVMGMLLEPGCMAALVLGG